MRLKLDYRAQRVLAMLPRASVLTVAELLVLLLLAIQAARLIWVIATPVGPVGEWRVARPGMNGTGAAMLRSFDPFFRLEPVAAPSSGVVTSLQLVLFGTRIDGASGRGSAIIAGPDGEQKSYSIGDEVSPGVTLGAVAFDHVTLRRGGADEDLFIDQSGGQQGGTALPAPAGDTGSLASAGPAAVAVPSKVTITQLRAEIGFIPRVDAGKITGLVVRPQGSGRIFRDIGLKEGDIVTQIAGRPVSGQADLDALASQFAKGGSLSLMVERGAEVLPLVVQVGAQ